MSKISFRFKAFLIHCLITFALLTLATLLVFYVWYPHPLDNLMGVKKIYVTTVLSIFVLGPFITFIVAKEDKKGLGFDFSFIGILQVIVLTYGLYSIGISRPAWIAFEDVRFEIVQANMIDYSKVDQSSQQYLHPSWFGPQYVMVRPAANSQEKNDRLFYELTTGFAPSMQPQLYMPFDKAWPNIMLAQKNVSLLSSDKVEQKALSINAVTGWLPINGYVNSAIVLLNTENQTIIKIVQ